MEPYSGAPCPVKRRRRGIALGVRRGQGWPRQGANMALTFWYDFSSSYSYLAAMRLEDVAARARVRVEWQPFLLGPIFQDAGYATTPNLMMPQKAQYMWADIGRRAASRGRAFVKPETFPQSSVLAARVALALPQHQRPAFSRAVFAELFERGSIITERSVVARAAEEVGLDSEALLAPQPIVINRSSYQVNVIFRTIVLRRQDLSSVNCPIFVNVAHRLIRHVTPFWQTKL